MCDSEMPWSETESENFIEVGRIYIPGRDEIRDAILDLIPAERSEPFLVVEIGTGAGWLSQAVLERFPRSSVIGFDGSPAMLREAERQLVAHSGRIELRKFRLEDLAWLLEIDTPVRCFVSSLVIHHLDGPSKQALYRQLYERLEQGGAVLIADLVAPTGERERRYMADRWDAEVKGQSAQFTSSLDAYQRFVDDRHNWFEYPDPVDMPSCIPDHLSWLQNAGFGEIDVFWATAGHAVYGGYKK